MQQPTYSGDKKLGPILPRARKLFA